MGEEKQNYPQSSGYQGYITRSFLLVGGKQLKRGIRRKKETRPSTWVVDQKVLIEVILA